MRIKSKEIKICSVCGITSHEKKIKFSTKANMYLCEKHYKQIYTYGKIIDPTPRTTHDKNEYILYDNHAEMILRDNLQREVARAIIDLDDVEKCKLYKWSYSPAKLKNNRCAHPYPRTKNKHFSMFLHRYILGYDGDMDVDHINRNPLDNRKCNLRIVPRVVNLANNGSENVYQDKRGNWRLDMTRYGIRFLSPYFTAKQDAIDYRDEILKYVDDHQKDMLCEYNKEKGY